jgi:hypothetical protein
LTHKEFEVKKLEIIKKNGSRETRDSKNNGSQENNGSRETVDSKKMKAKRSKLEKAH